MSKKIKLPLTIPFKVDDIDTTMSKKDYSRQKTGYKKTNPFDNNIRESIITKYIQYRKEIDEQKEKTEKIDIIVKYIFFAATAIMNNIYLRDKNDEYFQNEKFVWYKDKKLPNFYNNNEISIQNMMLIYLLRYDLTIYIQQKYKMGGSRWFAKTRDKEAFNRILREVKNYNIDLDKDFTERKLWKILKTTTELEQIYYMLYKQQKRILIIKTTLEDKIRNASKFILMLYRFQMILYNEFVKYCGDKNEQLDTDQKENAKKIQYVCKNYLNISSDIIEENIRNYEDYDNYIYNIINQIIHIRTKDNIVNQKGLPPQQYQQLQIYQQQPQQLYQQLQQHQQQLQQHPRHPQQLYQQVVQPQQQPQQQYQQLQQLQHQQLQQHQQHQQRPPHQQQQQQHQVVQRLQQHMSNHGEQIGDNQTASMEVKKSEKIDKDFNNDDDFKNNKVYQDHINLTILLLENYSKTNQNLYNEHMILLIDSYIISKIFTIIYYHEYLVDKSNILLTDYYNVIDNILRSKYNYNTEQRSSSYNILDTMNNHDIKIQFKNNLEYIRNFINVKKNLPTTTSKNMDQKTVPENMNDDTGELILYKNEKNNTKENIIKQHNYYLNSNNLENLQKFYNDVFTHINPTKNVNEINIMVKTIMESTNKVHEFNRMIETSSYKGGKTSKKPRKK
jgi:hypothetical protein